MTLKSSDPPAGQDPVHSHDPPPSYQASTDASSSTAQSPPLPPSNIYPNIQPYPSQPHPQHHSPSFGSSPNQPRGYTESSHLHPCPHRAVHYQQQQHQQQPHQIQGYRTHQPQQYQSQRGRGSPEAWSPPATDAIAKARARRRFLGAFCWAFLVYIILGSIIGSSTVDIHNSHNRRYHPRSLFPSASVNVADHKMDILATTPIPRGMTVEQAESYEAGWMPSF